MMMYRSLAVAALCTVVASKPGLAQDEGADEKSGWNFSIGAGAVYAPTYFGDDEYQVSIFPNISITYEDKFFASLDGVGYNVINADGLTAGPIAKYDFGRDEDGSNPLGTGDDTTDLIGLGDVDGTVELGGFVGYEIQQFSARLEVRQGLGGHEGVIGDIELKYRNAVDLLGMPVQYAIGPEISFGSENYNSAFFDVSAAQSAASGLAEYDAGSGINSYGLHASVVVQMTENVSVIGFGGIDQLSGDVADSSLVQERGSEQQGSAGLMLSYRF